MTNDSDTVNPNVVHAGKVAGRFRRSEDAARALQMAEQLGYQTSDVDVITRLSKGSPVDAVPADPERGTKLTEGPWAGALGGGMLGVFLGLMLGFWVPLIFDLPVNKFWPALILGGVMGLVGFYLGSLIGVLLPEGQEKEFKQAVKEGEVLLSVSPRSAADAEKLTTEWKQLGAEDVAN